MLDPRSIYQRILEGDPSAEEELVNYLRTLFGAGYRRSLGILAEDYLQELSVEAIEAIRRNRIEHPDALIPYCWKTANNIRINGIKKAARDSERLVVLEGDRHAVAPTQEVALLEYERAQLALSLIEDLEPVSQEIILRVYFRHQKQAQVCREMELSPNEFRGRKDRAVERLKQAYRRTVEPEMLAA